MDLYAYISRPEGTPLIAEEFVDIIGPLAYPNSTLGDVIDAQLDLFGFDGATGDLEHEMGHSVLGKSFLDMGYSPIRLESPHNGNIFSEPLVETLQAPISIYISEGRRVAAPSANKLREELESFAPGRVGEGFNALISCQDYVNRNRLEQTALAVFKEHDCCASKIADNPDMNLFSEPPPEWSDIFSDDDLVNISKHAAPQIEAILDHLERAAINLPNNATKAERRTFFNQALRDIPAAAVLNAGMEKDHDYKKGGVGRSAFDESAPDHLAEAGSIKVSERRSPTKVPATQEP